MTPLTYYSDAAREAARELRTEAVESWTVTLVTNVWAAVPLIHRYDPYAMENPATGCGRAVSGAILPYKHAARIGRHCKRCFREEAS